MTKKMKLWSPFHHRNEGSMLPWLWCNQTRTPSFRSPPLEPPSHSCTSCSAVTTNSSFMTNSESPSFSTESYDSTLEGIIRGGGRSERLFFEPAGETRAVVEKRGKWCGSGGGFTLEGSKAVVVDTEDPYTEFKRSMEEMVEMLGIEEWWCLVDMVGWFLRMNGEKQHGFILSAFLDMVLELNSCLLLHPPFFTDLVDE